MGNSTNRWGVGDCDAELSLSIPGHAGQLSCLRISDQGPRTIRHFSSPRDISAEGVHRLAVPMKRFLVCLSPGASDGLVHSRLLAIAGVEPWNRWTGDEG